MTTTAVEEWRPVHVTELVGLYEVSDLGRVRSLDRIRPGRLRPRRVDGKVLWPATHRLGYRHVNLFAGSFKKTFLVHRLVAFAFIPNPKHLPFVNHIDGMKGNNAAANLEWVDDQGNRQHAIDIGRITMYSKLLSPDEVAGIRRLAGTISQMAIARMFGTTQTNVSLIVRGLHHKAMGDRKHQ